MDCGGVSTCEHKRQRSQCIDCGGSAVCVKHKWIKKRCIFSPQANEVCAKHARVLHGWNCRKCRECKELALACSWKHTLYHRDGTVEGHFYEEIAAGAARGEKEADVRARVLACRGTLLIGM